MGFAEVILSGCSWLHLLCLRKLFLRAAVGFLILSGFLEDTYLSFLSGKAAPCCILQVSSVISTKGTALLLIAFSRSVWEPYTVLGAHLSGPAAPANPSLLMLLSLANSSQTIVLGLLKIGFTWARWGWVHSWTG